jgi:hypothetical protein
MQMQVGSTRWRIDPVTAVARVGRLTFAFALPLGPPTDAAAAASKLKKKEPETGQPCFHYVVTLPSAVPEDALSVLEAVLESVAQYRASSTLLEDTKASEGDATIGRALSRELPSKERAAPEEKKIGIQLGAAEQVPYSSTAARSLQRVATGVAGGLAGGAEWASGTFIDFRKRLTEGESTETPVEVSPALRKR